MDTLIPWRSPESSMAGDGVHEDAVGASKNSEEKSPAIQVKGLTYKFPDGSTGLKDVSFELPRGSRTLLIGGACLLPSSSLL